MHALVVCDEVGGATEPLARRVATGLRSEHFAVVQLASMVDATDVEIADAHLIVIGSPSPGALGRWNERLRERGGGARAVRDRCRRDRRVAPRYVARDCNK